MRRAPLALLVAVLAACGAGDDRSPEEVAREYLTSDDPGKCDDASVEWLESETGRRGDEARAACRRNVELTEPPRDVEYRRVAVDGARADVVFLVGAQETSVALRRDEDRWLVTGISVAAQSRG